MYLRTCRVQIPLMSAADFCNCDSFFDHRHRMIGRPSLNVQCCRLATCRPARCIKQVVGRKSRLAVRAGDVCDHDCGYPCSARTSRSSSRLLSGFKRRGE